MKERVLQFGSGNFLRAFIDWMIQKMSDKGLFDGSVVAVQSLPDDFGEKLAVQGGRYSVVLRGIGDGGKFETEESLVGCFSRSVDAGSEWDKVLSLAASPDIEFVFSNTTEAGIVYKEDDKLDDAPPASYPAKLAALLLHRWKTFNGDPGKGWAIFPCELIEYNGRNLREFVLKHAKKWGTPDEFVKWLDASCVFVNTLVDRVVSGYEPGGDALRVAGEFFHLFVIECPKNKEAELKKKLPFTDAGLHVIWTDDIFPYRDRKVRLLNGTHTGSVPFGFLRGLETVGDMMNDPEMSAFIKELVFDEILPAIKNSEGNEDLKNFAQAVLDRFANPSIKHKLTSILLNSSSKFKVRNLPSLLDYKNKVGRLPQKLSFGLAALLCVYRPEVKEKYNFEMKDDEFVLEFARELWKSCDGTKNSVRKIAHAWLGNEKIWGQNLNDVEGLTDLVASGIENLIF